MDYINIKNHPPIQEILQNVKPYQDELTEKWIKALTEKGIDLKDSDIEMYQYVLVMDLVKAIGNYLEKDDIIKNLKFSKEQGSIVISCTIIRNGEEYNFQTDVIIAGGYNIQKLHLRYIVFTKLPNKRSNPEYEKLNEQYKKMTKAQKIQEDIEKSQNFIKKYELKFIEAKENSKLSDSEVEKLSREGKPDYWKNQDLTWETMIERGADRNFDYDINKWKESQKEYKEFLIKSWRDSNANYKLYEGYIKIEKKVIEKLNKKISELGVTKMETGGTIVSSFEYTIGGL